MIRFLDDLYQLSICSSKMFETTILYKYFRFEYYTDNDLPVELEVQESEKKPGLVQFFLKMVILMQYSYIL